MSIAPSPFEIAATEKDRLKRLRAEENLSPTKRVTLNEALAYFNWSESCTLFFGLVMRDAPPAFRMADGEGLSAEWLFLQLLITSESASNSNKYSNRNLFEACGLTIKQLQKLQETSGGINTQNKLKGSEELYLNSETAEIIAAAGELGRRIGIDGITSMRHIVAAFLFRVTPNGRLLSYLKPDELGLETDAMLAAFRTHLEALDEKSREAQDTWKRAIELINGVLRGQKTELKRNASEKERCLDVDKYAEVLATLMRQADEKEFNLAVYGHWGRGKTFLMEQTAAAIKNPRPKDAREFETVIFSAWQYPSRPEVWIHLYETFAQKAFGGSFWKSVPNVIRAGIARHGANGLLMTYFLGAVALVPLLHKIEWAQSLTWMFYSAFGLSGILLCWSLYSSIKGTKKRLNAEYLTATRHSEKLGLQGTIGNDLETLLKGWLPTTGQGWWFYSAFTSISSFIAWILSWRIATVTTSEPIGILAATIFLAVAAVVCRWAFPWRPKPKKVLLVVDDLDRCDPDHLLSVMESIKLLLENPEISRRVLVSMLIEEDILKHAIWKKYKHLADENAAEALDTKFNGSRIIRENCEKLFTVHLRLSPLGSKEVAAVVEAFAPPDAPPAPATPNTAADASSQTGSTKSRTTPSTPSKAAKLYIDTDSTDASTQLSYAEISLGEEERIAISDELAKHRKGTEQLAPLGPRAIRAFIFRYQLARLILGKRGITKWKPESLIAALAARLFETKGLRSNTALPPDVMAVVEQVS